MTELPNGWTWMRLRELAVLKGGITKGNKRSRTSATRLVPYLRVANVQRGFLDLEEIKEIEADETEINALQLRPGDVLFNEGGDRDKLGRGWIWNGELPICIHQNHVFRARIRDGVLLPKLLSWYGNSLGQSYFLEHGKQTTNLASINLTLLGDLPVPVPPRDEQTPLVAEIETQTSRIEAGVAALKRVQANLKRYRASVFNAACEGRLVPTEAELARRESRDYEPASVLLQRILQERRLHWEASELAKLRAKGRPPTDDRWRARYEEPAKPDRTGLSELPEGWCWATADALCDGVDSGSTPMAEYFAPTGEGVPFLKVYNLAFDGSLDFSNKPTWIQEQYHHEKMTRSRVVPGDVLINIVGPPLGKVSIVPATYPEWNMNQAIVRFRALPGLEIGFLAGWLQGQVSQQWLRSTAKTTTSQVNLAVTTCRRLPIPLPPFAEQRRIELEMQRRLSLSSGLSATTANNVARAERLRQSILGAAFSGNLLPPRASDFKVGATVGRRSVANSQLLDSARTW